MIEPLKAVIRMFAKYSSSRSQKANLNVIVSLFFKGLSVLISFALIPMTLHYIKEDYYGVWLTLSSLVAWIGIFDVGIGNGLRNRLSESLANEDFELSKVYVSTTYVMITLIAIGLLGIYMIVTPFVNWQKIFNSMFVPESELNIVVSLVVVIFLLKFIADVINVVAAAFQMVLIGSILLFIGNVGIALGVWLLTKTSNASLVLFAICLSLIPFLVSVAANVYLFATKFKRVSPSLKCIDFKRSKGILSLGSQFFILQIITLIIFQTDNVLIAQLFKPADVTDFNILYRYYSVISIVFTIFLAPYWTAFTESFFKGDLYWIQQSMRRLIMYWMVSVVCLLVMIFVSSYVIRLWLGGTIEVSFSLSLCICLYIVVFNWNAIFANFLNSVGKIRLQIVYAIIMGVVNIPLCFFLVRVCKYGVYAIPLSNFLCLLFGGLISFIQYKKIISGQAIGIWNR